MLATCVTCVVLATAISGAPPARSYERWTPAPVATAREHDVFNIITSWARRTGRNSLAYDSRLAAAARHLTTFAPTTPGTAPPLERARVEAWRCGWTDGELAVATWRITAKKHLGDAIIAELNAKLAHVDANRVGVAVRDEHQQTVVVALMSRRLVNLSPLPARVRTGAELMVSGTLATTRERPAHLTLAVSYPNGTTHTLPLSVQSGGFAQLLDVGTAAGVLHLQLLVENGRGPEVAAQMPIGVGVTPWPDSGALAPDEEGDVIVAREHEPVDALRDLVWGARQAHGLPVPSINPSLVDAAKEHADDMHGHAFFAHVSPQTGDVTQRLASRGTAFARVEENIAAANSAEEIFAAWMQSPSHRANILDPSATTMGLAVAPGIPPNRWVAVLVLAHLADQGSDAALAERALAALNHARAAHGLPALRRDPGLSMLAQAHSLQCAERDAAEDGLVLVQAALDRHDKAAAAADIYESATVDVVTSSRHLAEAFSSVGVGVAHGTTPAHALWLSVVFASP